MRHESFTAIISIGFSLLTSCLLQEPCTKHYAFEFPVTVTPQDTFIIGDTIWWEMDIPNQLMDHNSGDYVDITDFELFFSFGIEKIDSTAPITGSGHIHLFVPVVGIGSIEQRNNVLAYTYLLTKSIQDKHFKIGFIPTMKGTYNGSVSFPALYYNLEDEYSEELIITSPQCRETITHYSSFKVNDGDINYHMLEGTCRYTLAGERRCYGPISELPMYSLYAFHVKAP